MSIFKENTMEKILFLFTLFTTITFSQNINDALLYSNENNYGTARYQSMSGAFGALGGDFSSINDNPAGSAVFKNSLVTGSLILNSKKNEANYFNTTTNTTDSNLNINQLGGAFVLNSSENSDWNKIVLAINYEQTEDFNTEYFISGKSNNSISSYFLNQANGLAFQDIQILPGELIEEAYLNIGSELGFQYQQAFLGYYGGLIDPTDSSDPLNTTYVGTGDFTTVNQEYFHSSTGSANKINFNVATQYKSNLYLGASLNLHTINHNKQTSIRENGYETTSALNFARFNNYLYTEGAGFSFQLGVIQKMKSGLRLGASFQSPTWYTISEELSQSINSNLADAEISYIGLNQVNVFQDYKLRTPLKLTGSIAMVLGKKGLVSIDYHYKDYNNIKMKPNNNFSNTNTEISKTLKGTSAINVGGEYRIQKWSLRAGYRFEETPFKNQPIADDLTGYSLGFGYDFGKTKLDFSYSRSTQKNSHQLYDTGLTNLAKIDDTKSSITTSLIYNF